MCFSITHSFYFNQKVNHILYSLRGQHSFEGGMVIVCDFFRSYDAQKYWCTAAVVYFVYDRDSKLKNLLVGFQFTFCLRLIFWLCARRDSQFRFFLSVGVQCSAVIRLLSRGCSDGMWEFGAVTGNDCYRSYLSSWINYDSMASTLSSMNSCDVHEVYFCILISHS